MVNADRARTGPWRAWAGPDMGQVGPVWPGHVSLTSATTLRVQAPTGPLVHQAWLTVDSHMRRMDRRTGSRWAEPTAPSSLSWSTVDQVHMGAAPLLFPSPPPNSSVLAGECPPAVNGRLGGYWSIVFHPLSFLRLGKAGPVERGTDDRSAWRRPRSAATSGDAPVVPWP
jgi:hypothetical protein